MRKSIKTTILLLISMHLLVAEAYGNIENQIHTTHIGSGTAGIECATCHGAPPNVVIQIQARNGSGPGGYIVCEQCHAPPPDSMKPSMGNLVTIHQSRGTECTRCHDTDTIIPSHPSSKGDNGTVKVINCEKCHPDSEKSISHVNGGKYCMQCHGGTGPTVTATQAQTPTKTFIQPTAIPTSNLEQEVRELKERLNKTDERQSKQETRISGLESVLRSIIDRIRSIF